MSVGSWEDLLIWTASFYAKMGVEMLTILIYLPITNKQQVTCDKQNCCCVVIACDLVVYKLSIG